MRARVLPAFLLLTTSALWATSNGAWLRKVPDSDRKRVNPYASKPEAVAAGKLLFDEHCAQCHGSDARGRHGHPNLRSERVQHATDGELAWLLRNGSLGKGMPSWSSLPEPERWQIIAYLRSLPPDPAPVTTANNPRQARTR